MIDKLKEQYRDIYGYALLLDIVRFKEGLDNERQTKVVEREKSIQHFFSK